jgi:drug/metabolite transporter (DMT)-like permease
LSIPAVPDKPGFKFSHRQSVGLVVLGTFLAAAAQVLIKRGASGLESRLVLDMITNVNLLAGYSLYGIFTLLLSLALRDTELSILYPIISLTFVWVALLSVAFFGEQLTLFKMLGIAIICCGVALLGSQDQT